MRSRLAAGVRWTEDPAPLCLALAVVFSGAIVISLVSQLTFVSDEWELLLNRRGLSPGDLLDPFHEHIVLAPALIYRLLAETFGMDSALPFQVVATAVFLLSAVLLFIHLRPRVGDWPAFLAAALILFLGAAFEDLLFAFQVGFYGSIAAGIGMLMALDRGDVKGDRIACLLLVVSLSFSSNGLCFAAGALVHVLLGPRPRVRRLYVALLPLELWALWWLGWGHTAESDFSLGNLDEVPRYVFEGASAGIVSLLGLATGDGSEPDQPHLIYGKLLLLAGVALAAFRLWRRRRFPRDLAVVLAIALSFWGLAALNLTPERMPTSSRYQYPAAVFILLIAGELLRGVRIPDWTVLAGVVVVVLAAWGGLSLMYREHDERWLPGSNSLRGWLAGVEIARDEIDPSFRIDFRSIEVPARIYLRAVDEDGSPAYSEAELAARPEFDRGYADGALAAAMGLRLEAAAGGPVSGCQALGDPAAVLSVGPGTYVVRNEESAAVDVRLGRFSDGLPVGLGPLPPGAPGASLTIPADRSTRPWHLGLGGPGEVEVCATSAAASVP
jgi:hypothetical protein